VPNPLASVGRCARSVDGDQGENIEYYDVGDHITFDLSNGESVDVPRLLPDPAVPDCMPGKACAAGVVDFYGRLHQVAYLLETVTPPGTLGDDYYNHYQSVRLPDNTDLSDKLDKLYLGPSFTVTKPVWNPAEGALALKRGQDVTFEWENEQEPNRDVLAAAAIVIVPDVSTQATGCISLNDGSFTIPGETIDALEDDTGIMLVGNGSDEAVLTDDGRIFHKWGVFCNLIPWTRVE
jgi:hypothetical protein